MGDDSDERSRPAHPVHVDSFEIGRNEVTNVDYLACVSAGMCTPPHWDDETCYVYVHPADGAVPMVLPANRRADLLPVTCVTWNQARLFSAWVGGRQPSEAEWEYAARSRGLDVAFPWGAGPFDCEHASYTGCGLTGPDPVCSHPAGDTTQGLCDMIGNAAELVEDWYHLGHVGAPEDGSSWMEPPGEDRVSRGSAWTSGRRLYTWSRREVADRPSDSVGFRVARDVPTAPCQGVRQCGDENAECTAPEPGCVLVP
jgi:formylglycine-generating enzyme required for sulfatase activity